MGFAIRSDSRKPRQTCPFNAVFHMVPAGFTGKHPEIQICRTTSTRPVVIMRPKRHSIDNTHGTTNPYSPSCSTHHLPVFSYSNPCKPYILSQRIKMSLLLSCFQFINHLHHPCTSNTFTTLSFINLQLVPYFRIWSRPCYTKSIQLGSHLYHTYRQSKYAF